MENENENVTEMETIMYQGREIEAELMGNMPRDREDHWVHDSLYRDAAGCYYVQREMHLRGPFSHPGWARENAEESGYRCLVHRVNVNAAILWALSELGNGDPWSLRVDAGNLLMAGAQGTPALTLPALNTTHRFADGSMAVTVLFKPEAAKLLDAGCRIDRKTLLQWVYDSTTGDLVATLRENFRCWAAREEHELKAVFAASEPEADVSVDAAGLSVSAATLEAAARYAATAGRTLDEMLSEFLEMTADMAPQGQTDHDVFQPAQPVADREEVVA